MSSELLPLTTYRSGSIGTDVHARNQHGPYTRSRTVPTDPNTPRQQRIRTRWAAIVARWATDLSRQQRLAWRDYARQLNELQPDGRPKRFTGQTAFIRSNMARQTNPLGIVLDPPQALTNDPDPDANVNALLGVGVLTISWHEPAAWATDNAGALIVFVSDEQSNRVNFFKGPWRRAGIVRGNSTTPPTSPATRFDPWTTLTSLNRWHRYYAIRGDGRLTPSTIRHFT